MHYDSDGTALLAPRQAGDGVRQVLLDREFREMMCMTDVILKESQAGVYNTVYLRSNTDVMLQ